jgi:hypothetical protein
MALFQKIVLFTAIIILLLSLVIMGFALNSKSSSLLWPPFVADCPDYWLIDGSGNNSRCINIKDLGTCPPNSNDKHLVMNFNDPVYTGTNGLCAKYNWATNCNVSWDGITYGVNNPCQS